MVGLFRAFRSHFLSNENSVSDTPELMVSRKNDHIRICAEKDVESRAIPFENVRFIPEALPEIDFKDIQTAQHFLGQSFALPFLITGMTGGVERGQEINCLLAEAAERHGIPMGLGSQKMMMVRPELKRLFDVRKRAPRVFLIGNVGAVSFNYGITLDDIRRVIDSLELNAFAFHVNALQECIQPEGERNFSGLLRHIETAVKVLPVPVVVKEVGSGMSLRTFQQLANCGVAAVDVGGSGGTSWSVIEGLRGNPQGKALGELFRNWGLTTEESVRQCAQHVRERGANGPAVIATGGIRDGMQAAKALALGAQMVGIGLPLFRAIVNPEPGMSPELSLDSVLHFYRKSLEITMFCTGAPRLSELENRLYEKRI